MEETRYPCTVKEVYPLEQVAHGLSHRFLYFGMLAVTIVLAIQVVGLILVIALLTIPPFIVEKYANSLVQMMVAACLLGAVFTIAGLGLAYR